MNDQVRVPNYIDDQNIQQIPGRSRRYFCEYLILTPFLAFHSLVQRTSPPLAVIRTVCCTCVYDFSRESLQARPIVASFTDRIPA